MLDVGGGPGPYAATLAARGFEVHLLDPVALHVDQARQRAAEAGVALGSAEVGDARALPYADASAEVVLLLGPPLGEMARSAVPFRRARCESQASEAR